MRIFTSMAVLDFKTLLSIATPFSVKANGTLRVPPQLDITFCDIKFENSNEIKVTTVSEKAMSRRMAYRDRIL